MNLSNHGCEFQTIRLIVTVSKVINQDPDTKDYLTLLFLPDYSVTSIIRV